MSYAAISRTAYSELFPQSMTHAGSPGWTKSPIPSWGENPLRAGPYSLGAGPSAAELEAMSAQAAAKAQAEQEAKNEGERLRALVATEDAALVDPKLEQQRAEYTKIPLWAYLAVGTAGVAGVGMIVYVMRSHHGR